MTGSITDVPGIRVGQVQRVGDGWRTGVTVILPPPGTEAMADVSGAVPATREVTGLKPGGWVTQPHAVVFSGGSSFGLIAAHGVMRYLAERGIGHRVGTSASDVVPIVPGAAIYDLGRGGQFSATPTEAMGYEAAAAAAATPLGGRVARGRVGAGTGATVDNERGPGGVGSASLRVTLDGSVPVWLGALVVANPYGVPLVGPGAEAASGRAGATGTAGTPPPFNTVLVALATDARLEAGDLSRTARAAQDGIARAVDPVHTLADGDTVIALATGAVPPADGQPRWRRDSLIALQAGAAHVATAAIADALAG
ncbi:MAG: P1 family peptidase [Bifidobacteriaceae bacterium]|jgi:L-aminopeptidase/D-esterase-like protein|nr:P1 family peptidase [Bifidobacteriaceae bacterium]